MPLSVPHQNISAELVILRKTFSSSFPCWKMLRSSYLWMNHVQSPLFIRTSVTMSFLTNLHFQCLPKSCSTQSSFFTVRTQNCAIFISTPLTTQISPFLTRVGSGFSCTKSLPVGDMPPVLDTNHLISSSCVESAHWPSWWTVRRTWCGRSGL